MSRLFYAALSFIVLLSAARDAFADRLGMMGGPGMMAGGGQMGMGGAVFMGLFGIIYLAGAVLFLWLLFRIVWALEEIARAKKGGE